MADFRAPRRFGTPRSGTFRSGSDSRRQTAQGVKGLGPDPGLEGREEGANREGDETKEETRE